MNKLINLSMSCVAETTTSVVTNWVKDGQIKWDGKERIYEHK